MRLMKMSASTLTSLFPPCPQKIHLFPFELAPRRSLFLRDSEREIDHEDIEIVVVDFKHIVFVLLLSKAIFLHPVHATFLIFIFMSRILCFQFGEDEFLRLFYPTDAVHQVHCW